MRGTELKISDIESFMDARGYSDEFLARQLKLRAAYRSWTKNRRPRALKGQQSPYAPNLKWITYQGKTLIASEWADEMGIPRQTLWARLRNGWTVERALTTNVRRYRRSKSVRSQ